MGHGLIALNSRAMWDIVYAKAVILMLYNLLHDH